MPKNSLMIASFQPRTLRGIRLMHGVSQITLARAVGLRQRHSVRAWEKPDNDKVPSEEQLRRIAEFFSLPVEAFKQPLDVKFKEVMKGDIEDYCVRAINSENTFENRLALDFFRHAFPESWEEKEKEKESTVFNWDIYRNPGYHAFNTELHKEILNKVYSDTEIKFIMSGPTRTAKTLFGLDIAFHLMFEVPNFQALALRTDAVDLRDTVRKSIKELQKYDLDHPNCPFEVRGGLSDFHTLIVKETKSQMVLGGLNRPGRVLGTAWDGIFVSQIEMTDNDQYRKLMTRISAPAGNWKDENGINRSIFWADANPDRIDHYLMDAKKEGEFDWYEFQFTDNPRFYNRGEKTQQWPEVDRLEKNLKHSKVHYDRYFLGKWGNPEGAVFNINDANIIPMSEVPPLEECDLYRAQDYGSDHPSVNIWIALHKETKNRYVYREWRLTRTDIDVMADQVKAFTGDESIEETIIEIDENRQSLLQKRGIPSVMARKGPGSVMDGIYLMNAAFRRAQEGVNGGLYFVEGLKCNTDPNPDVDPDMDIIKEARNCVYSQTKDAPEKKNDDAIDAYRYFELWLNDRLEEPVIYVGSIKKGGTDNLFA